MHPLKIAGLAGALALPAIALAGDNSPNSHKHPAPPKASAALERLKSLAGTWEGPNPMDPKGKMLVEYRVTSGGAAVEERFGAGSPHEMITMYYDKAGTTELTHFCTMGNRPAMSLKSSDSTKLVFDYIPGSTATVDEPHMHALTLTTPAKDKLSAAWSMWEKGKEKAVHSVSLTRKKS